MTATTSTAAHLSTFLEALWSPGWHSLNAKTPGGTFEVVGLHDDPRALAEQALALQDRCVWWGVHGMAERPAKRGGNADVTSVHALVADLDWHHRAHKNSPELSEAEVRRALADFTPAPTIVVNTGHGLQAYWRLDEVVSGELGEGLTKRLHGALKAVGLNPERRDLASVLRVPGTTNWKLPDEPVPVVIESDDGPTWTVAEIESQLVPMGTTPQIERHTLPSRNGHRLDGPGPMDRVRERLDLADELTRRGWCHVRDEPLGAIWSRPGREPPGDSARINTTGRLYVFTTSTPLPVSTDHHDATFDALDVIAHYDHRGDRTAAAKAIAPLLGVEWSSSAPTPPAGVDAETGEIRREAGLPEEFWAHPRLAHLRAAAWSRGRAPTAVLGCALARIAAHLDHRYALPPIVGGIGSLNAGFVLVAPTGAGKSSSDAVAEELLEFDVVAGDPEPRGVPLGSGEGVAEAYMGTRPATDDEKEAGLAVQGKIREQRRWRELFIGDEGEAILSAAKRSGATLLPTLRSLLTGGALGQQNAAADNRRLIPAHQYRAGVLLGFQVTTAAELLDDAAGGTPGRFTFVAGTDPSIPPPGERPEWPGSIAIEPPPAVWRDQLPRGRGRRLIPVCSRAADELLEQDYNANAGTLQVEAVEAHANLLRLRNAAHLATLLDGRPEVTELTWELAGMLRVHSRSVITTITATARADRLRRERETSERLAERAVVAAQRTEAHRVVEAARRIADRVRAEPGITRVDLRRAMRRWRDEFDEALSHAKAHGWVDEQNEPSHTGSDKRSLIPGKAKS